MPDPSFFQPKWPWFIPKPSLPPCSPNCRRWLAPPWRVCWCQCRRRSSFPPGTSGLFQWLPPPSRRLFLTREQEKKNEQSSSFGAQPHNTSPTQGADACWVIPEHHPHAGGHAESRRGLWIIPRDGDQEVPHHLRSIPAKDGLRLRERNPWASITRGKSPLILPQKGSKGREKHARSP